MAYTARRIPSPCGAGRGSGRGVPGKYEIVFRQCFQGFPLSPALSPLVPRGEREKTKRRLPPVPLSSILRTALYEAQALVASLVSGDEGNGEAIIAFAADRLDRRGAYARFRGQQFVEAAHALDVGIAARGVGHRAFAHDVIGDDQAAATGEFERPPEVIRIGRFVGVNEDQIKWAATLGGELRQRLQ